MWPFKSKTTTTAMSGVLDTTCDGKHHHWSKWMDVEAPFVLRNMVTGEWIDATQIVQERRCLGCNLRQQRKIDD